MKSAYELAMERLNAESPAGTSLSDEQREQLAEIDKVYKAKAAEREIFLNKQIADALNKGNHKELQMIQRQKVDEKIRIEEEREMKKDKVRNQGK